MTARLAEIEVTGGTAFQHNLPDLCRSVQSGKVVRLVHLQTGRHRGWFTRERPGGCDPERVTIYELGRAVGRIFDDVRDGQVFMVWNGRENRPVGYIAWCCPEWLELLAGTPMTYTYRSKNGREIRRDFYPLAVEAVPLPPRKHTRVMASA
jgi:hypothetical protein